jgi:predicted ATPase
LTLAELGAAIAQDQGYAFWHAGATIIRGWAVADGGDRQGIDLLRQGLASWQATGSVTYLTYFLALLADAEARHGQVREARTVVDEALTVAHRTSETFFEAELLRMRGELLLREAVAGSGDAPTPIPNAAAVEAENCYRQAMATARRQQARSLELRAATSLARLLRDRGRPAEGRQLLAEACAGFSEGRDTRDLLAAEALRDELAWWASAVPFISSAWDRF